MVVPPSPTEVVNSVSNFAWSWAVIKDSRMLGILFDFCEGAGAAVGLPVWNEAAIWLNPVAWGFCAGAGADADAGGGGATGFIWLGDEKPVGCENWNCGG